MNKDKRYQLYGYGNDPERLAGGQVDLGQFDERMDAEVQARSAVRSDGFRAAHVLRCSDMRVVYHFDREELS